MFIFSEGNIIYSRIGLVLMLAQFWLFICAMPPFQYGIWLQTEPVMVGLFATSALNCLWLGFGLARKWLVPQPVHPVLFCLLLWVGWQILITIGSSNSWRSWFGAGETGEGTGWYVMQLLEYMVIYPLWRDGALRKILIAGASASLITQTLLHWEFPSDQNGLYVDGSWSPAEWAAYLAFMAAPLWIALVAGNFVKTKRGYGVMILLAIPVLVISNNKSAMGLFPGAMLCSLFMASLPAKSALLRQFFYPGRRWRMAAVMGCLLPLAWIAFSAYYPAFPATGPEILSKKDGPISSRLVFNKVGISTMEHEPWRWLVSDGWGRFSDDLFKYVLVDGVTVFKNGQHDPNWFMVDGHADHSHNQILEALLSLGLPGMLLWFTVPMVALMFMPEELFWGCAPMLVAQVALSALWFELAQCMPYQALGWVALSAVPLSSAGFKFSIKSGWAAILLIPVGLLMLFSVEQQLDAIRYGDSMLYAIRTKDYKKYDLAWMERDLKHDGERFRSSALGYAKFLNDLPKITEGERNWYAQFMRAALLASQFNGVGPRVASTDAWLQYKLMLDYKSPLFSDLGHDIVTSLPESLVFLASIAPLRDDIASFYLMNLADVTHGDANKQVDILNRILAVAPNHRGALWLLGTILGKTPGHEEQGKAMCARAIERGVATIYPVTDAEAAAAVAK